MGSTSVTPFTGSSAFAAQLQTVIQTAVSRASAPLTQLQTQQNALQSQQSEIQNIQSDFNALQSAITSLNSAVQSNGMAAQVSNSTVASANVSNGALSGTYTVNVTSLGSQASAISENSLPTVTDPSTQSIDTASSYTLTVEGQSYTIQPAGNTLDALVSAINNSGANVQATVVNVGSNNAPDYRLTIQANDYVPTTIQLNDGTNNLLQAMDPGSYVQYQVNGEPASPINATSRQVTVSPGVNVTLLGAGTTNITVAASTAAISNALNTFVTDYNNLAAELEKNRGKNGGALSGQSIVYELQNQLQMLVQYSGGSGSVTSLADIGLSFDSSGNLQFDSSALSADSASSVLNFFGSTSNSGFLQNANNVLNSVTDPSTGTLTDANQSLTSQLTQIGAQITSEQTSISNLQQKLATQMANADAAISSLEQQVTEITDLFTSMQQQSRSISG